MTMLTRTQRATLEGYYQERLRQAEALTPGLEIELVARLRREAHGEDPAEPGQCRVPRAGGGVTLIPADHPLVTAVLNGETVQVGGETVEGSAPTDLTSRLQALSLPKRLAVLAGIFLTPIGLGLLLLMGRSASHAAPLPTPTATPTATVTPTATPSPTPTVALALEPTRAPEPTATPYAFARLVGSAAPAPGDPASLELAGFSFVLGQGEVIEGQWQPAGAEWLVGTHLRRVVALPYEPELAQLFAESGVGLVAKLRLRSGAVVRYRVTEGRRVGAAEIEHLAGRTPSLVIFLAGEPSAQRWLLVAQAEQTAPDFSDYPLTLPAPQVALPEPALPLSATTTLTTTRTITDAASGLVLTVGACERKEQIGEAEPPEERGYLLCNVTLRALEGNGGNVPYSGQGMAITEGAWVEARADWWPASIPVSGGLRSGTLPPGRSTRGRVAGLVRVASRSPVAAGSSPVLLWEPAPGRRYLIDLEGG